MTSRNLRAREVVLPDYSGALTPGDHEKVKAFFAKHWKDPVTCPVCKNTSWTYAPHIVKVPRFAPDGLQPGTIAYGYLPVLCNTCAHTIFFGAAAIGITFETVLPAAATNPLLAPQDASGISSLARLLYPDNPTPPGPPGGRR
jgi:hypothetical protein